MILTLDFICYAFFTLNDTTCHREVIYYAFFTLNDAACHREDICFVSMSYLFTQVSSLVIIMDMKFGFSLAYS